MNYQRVHEAYVISPASIYVLCFRSKFRRITSASF